MKMPKIVRRFMFSYLLVFAVPLITGIIIYQVSYNMAKSKSIQTSKMVLNQSKDILDRRMIEVDRLTRLLATNENLNRLLNSSDTDQHTRLLEMRKLSQDLSVLSQSNNMLKDIYIYLKDQNIIISPGSTYYRIEHFYENNKYVNLDFEQWTNMLKNGNRTVLPLQTIGKSYEQFDAISSIYPIPYNAIQEVKGVAVVVINENNLLELFDRITDGYSGWAYIVDSNDNLLAKTGIDRISTETMNIIRASKKGATNFYANDDLVISTLSNSDEWTIVAGIPKDKILVEANRIKTTTITVALLTVLVGLSICFLLSYRNSAPINRILKYLKQEESETNLSYKNEFAFLEGNISQLVNTNRSLRVEIEEQKPLLKSAVINRLLRGEFSIDEEIEEAMKQAEFYFPGNNVTGNVTILSISGYEIVEKGEEMVAGHALRIIIKTFMADKKMPFLVTDMSHNKLVLIHIFPYEKMDQIYFHHEQYLIEIFNHVQFTYKLPIAFGVGDVFTKYKEISRSFREADDALNYAHLMGNHTKIIHYQDVESKKSFFYYPLDIEIRLMNALKVGLHEEVCHLMDEVFDRNLKEKELSTEMVLCLIQEMKATFLKELQANTFTYDHLKNEMKHLYAARLEDGIENIKKRFSDLSEKHSDLLQKRKKEVDEQLVKEVMTFIELNYSDPNMGVTMICDYVKRSEKFLSRLFKENTGFYVSEFLERYRLENAEKLLSTTEKTIDEIATLSGYNSAHTFRRAFKRIYDLTPNQCRKYTSDKIPEITS
ncbi:helix-turn-helix domain-containing protein [Lederbergia citrea]|uniref:helix-turn-helix domain-containing protein n=1 Tax=Lederbergia citrea TaxID=2833581 RepID=UPI001BC8FC2F|nr:helix-turn-helix domain-containing protein [Lederbergia citrea]MBS4204902.1 AraC family transcriptional regulator [Lederbergia citrea]